MSRLMSKKVIILCLDGCGPEYIRLSHIPFMKSLCKAGVYIEGRSMIPSVTNVNAVSILTGKYPEEHGITTNYYFDPETGNEVYMETSNFIRVKTLLEFGCELGLKTALLTSKDKLRTLLDKGASISFSAENPPKWIVKALGSPPPIYSIDIDLWLIKALRELMLREDPALIFAMTTDYVMHKYSCLLYTSDAADE